VCIVVDILYKIIFSIDDLAHPPIILEEFYQHVHSNMKSGFYDEYKSLGLPEWSFNCYNANLPVNKIKNRYTTILPCMLLFQKTINLVCHFYQMIILVFHLKLTTHLLDQITSMLLL